LLVHEPREEKREWRHGRERGRERAITKTNEREDKLTNKNTYAIRTEARSFYICLLQRFILIDI
jgi:hypothetical protein